MSKRAKTNLIPITKMAAPPKAVAEPLPPTQKFEVELKSTLVARMMALYPGASVPQILVACAREHIKTEYAKRIVAQVEADL